MKESPHKVSDTAEPFDRLPMTPVEFSQLVAVLYQGAFESTPWSTFLKTIRDALRANWVTLILRLPTSARRALIVNAGPRGIERPNDQFASEYAFATDPFAGLPDGQVLSVADVIGDAAWVNSEFFSQFVEPYGIRYMIGADLSAAAGVECRLRICRPADSGEFSAEDKVYCQVLLPHLKQAIHLHANLDAVESERTLLGSAVDNLLVGIVILDEHGVIVKTNSAANDIFAENDGLSIVECSVQAADENENRELARLIAGALGHSAGRPPADATSVTRPSGRQKLGVLVRALPANEWSEGPRRSTVAIFIRDGDRHSKASREVIQHLYDLTAAEASLALLLANGLNLDEAADALAIRKNTARAHLRSIFSKTAVTRQTALVHLILSSVASLA